MALSAASGDLIDDETPHTADILDPGVLAAAFDAAPTGIAIVGPDGRILRANRALGELLGLDADALSGRTVHEFGHPADEDIRLPDRAGLLAGQPARSVYVKRYRRSDGRTVWLRVATSGIESAHGPVLLSHFHDVSDEQRAARRAGHAAAHDPLTGLLNRTRLSAVLDDALEPAADGANPPEVAVMFIDLDDFKVVNDRFGHDTGDRLLQVVARRLAAAVAPGELARFGGDEFVAVHRCLALEEIPVVCRRILHTFAEPFQLDGLDLDVGVSIGVARARPGADSADLIREADRAMYAAKQAGRNRFMVSDEVVRAFTGDDTLDWAVDDARAHLADVLAAESLVLHAQPLVELASMRISGVEVLARWRDDAPAHLSPGALIGPAARAGVSRAFGRWALNEACRHRGDWVRRTGNPDLGISVNIDGDHLVDAAFVDDVRSALAASSIPPGALTVEITERSMVDAFPAVVDRLAELVEDGVRVSLDDFGTGWSSLSYLRLLPVAELKLDRTFVAGAAQSPRDLVILSALSRLGRALGLDVVAEGIETVADLAACRAAGATTGQGFLLGRPSVDGADWPALPDLPD